MQKPKGKTNDWVLILDESIGIGQEKLFVILGIRKCDINFSRPLKLQDLTPLTIKSKNKWTGTDMAAELRIVEQQIGKILYVVCDGLF